MSGPIRRWRTALAAAAATAAATAAAEPEAVDHGQPEAEAVPEPWLRQNYRGRPVDLRGGPALAGGVLLAALQSAPDSAATVGPTTAVALAGAAGLLDDLRGDGSVRGLKGHLGRLRRGQVTTGVIKLVAVAVGAAVFAVTAESARSQRRRQESLAVAGRASGAGARRRQTRRRQRVEPASAGASWGPGAVARIGVDTVLVAGVANLVNLLDLRPGRALKAAGAPAALLAVAPGAGGELAAGLVGAVAAAAPSDLSERTMLGDCGANALGAGLGVALAQSLRWPARLVLAGAAATLVAASERVSFSKVIAANPRLRRLDEWGRRNNADDSGGDGLGGDGLGATGGGA
ncbi:MAG: hypothetical protein LBS27_11220 [Bifidobacteriaceae bacterium]|nr:hypothetical protein [Bifidobacteriaceae bacterium]